MVSLIGANESPGKIGRQPGGCGWSLNLVLNVWLEGVGFDFFSCSSVRSLSDFLGCLYFIFILVLGYLQFVNWFGFGLFGNY